MLSQRGRYALKAMLHLARAGNEARQGWLIAQAENIPPKFLEAIMTDLRRADLIVSQRGKQGGFRLARSAQHISFSDIMRVADGPIALLACVSLNFYQRCDDCPDEAACTLRRVMHQVRVEVTGILDRTTLASAIADENAVLSLIDLA